MSKKRITARKIGMISSIVGILFGIVAIIISLVDGESKAAGIVGLLAAWSNLMWMITFIKASKKSETE